MPIRNAANHKLAELIAGEDLGSYHRVDNFPAVYSREFHQRRLEADRIFVQLVEYIDWNRLLIQASRRHAIVHSEKHFKNHGFGPIAGVCGECLREALLDPENHGQDWRHETKASRVHHVLEYRAR